MEWSHRMAGRCVGFAFAVPLTYFVARGYVDRALAARLGLLFCMGGTQVCVCLCECLCLCVSCREMLCRSCYRSALGAPVLHGRRLGVCMGVSGYVRVFLCERLCRSCSSRARWTVILFGFTWVCIWVGSVLVRVRVQVCLICVCVICACVWCVSVFIHTHMHTHTPVHIYGLAG